jgi:hypothetical protein
MAATAAQRRRRRSSVSQVVKRASVAFVSIDYNQFEAAFLICSVRGLLL